MREVTVAKGQLRCGECNTVFNATKSLSTTIPASYQELEDAKGKTIIDVHEELMEAQVEERAVQSTPITMSVKETPKTENTQEKVKTEKTPRFTKKISWPLIAILALATLLIFQVLYNSRHILLGAPLHEPEKIQMLNHNIFAHPNETGVLLISAQIENTAEHDQPYPVLELSLKDAQSNLIAFRRFMPKEYLKDYSEEQLIPSKVPINLKLKIKDPGSKATRFQFEFL
jgi:hypothetical protein